MRGVSREEGLASVGGSVYASCRSGRSGSMCFRLLNLNQVFIERKLNN